MPIIRRSRQRTRRSRRRTNSRVQHRIMNTNRISLYNTRNVRHARRKGRTSILLRKSRIVRRYKHRFTRYLEGSSRSNHLTKNRTRQTNQNSLEEVCIIGANARRLKSMNTMSRCRYGNTRCQKVSATRRT